MAQQQQPTPRRPSRRHAALVHGLALDVEARLEDAAWGGPAFEMLIAYGEELRRALVLADQVDAFAEAVLERYDAELHELRAEIPRAFDLSLRVALDALPGSHLDGEDVLRTLDSVLARAAVACRVGVRPAELAWTLGERARAYVAQCAPQLRPVWAMALQRASGLGADPDYPGLYSYLDVLAVHADGAEAA